MKDALVNEIGMDLPKEVQIIKVEFERVFDASHYKVTYLENGEEKVREEQKDADGIQLDQYMKQYGKTNDNIVFFIVLVIVLFQILLPIICLRMLIKEVKENKNSKKVNS